MIEENMWRALRYGLDGDLLDLDRRAPYPAAGALDRLLEWTAPVRAELGIDVALPMYNGAQRQRRMLSSGMSLAEVYAAVQAQTRETYSGVLETPRR
jgi:carboxylate-amine ligase